PSSVVGAVTGNSVIREQEWRLGARPGQKVRVTSDRRGADPILLRRGSRPDSERKGYAQIASTSRSAPSAYDHRSDYPRTRQPRRLCRELQLHDAARVL